MSFAGVPERAKEIFEQAIETRLDERQGFLDRACAHDDALLALVTRMISEFEKMDDRLSSPIGRSGPGKNLASGTMLGPYEIRDLIGVGGMGQVYRAEDKRLARTIAIKILPDLFSNDRDRLSRFSQEARLIGALNHPNILAVYDIGVSGDIHYIVTEFLRGSTVRERLERRPIPWPQAAKYAAQIAAGLAAAHEVSIVHRDLKPGNLFVTKDERVKILDFGLAKVASPAVPNPLCQIPLENDPRTFPGMVLGSASYMAPEQVRGESVDHRADIFAFGAVLYEMLAGHRAFHANSPIETMTAVLEREPAGLPIAVKEGVPEILVRIMQFCLEKDPRRRCQSALDLSVLLDGLAKTEGEQQKTLKSRTLFGKQWIPVAFLGVLLAASATWIVMERMKPIARQPQFERVTFRPGTIASARFSQDGQSILYSASWDAKVIGLYSSRSNGADLRALELPSSTILSVAKSGELAITLNDTGNLAQVRIGGEAPRELLDHVVAADWSPDSKQLAVVRVQNGQHRLEYPIGKLLYQTAGYIDSVRVSPHGDLVAFMDHPRPDDDRGSVALVDSNGNKRNLTLEWIAEDGLAWSPDGKEIWFTAALHYDWARDLYAVTPRGRQRLLFSAPGALRLEDVSPDGRALLRLRDRRSEVVAKDGNETRRLLGWLQLMLTSAISHDGKYAVVTDWGGSGGADYSTYLAKLDGSSPIRLGDGIGGDISPDDARVTAVLPRDPAKVMLLPTGVGEVETVSYPNFRYQFANWASDGRRLVVYASESHRPFRFWIEDTHGGTPRAITPEGTTGTLVILKHTDYVCVRDPHGGASLYPIDGKIPMQVRGVTKLDTILGGRSDSNEIYVSVAPSTSRQNGVNREIWEVNVSTGRRLAFLEVSPADPDGVVFVGNPHISDDGKHYIMNQTRSLSVLYLASGLK